GSLQRLRLNREAQVLLPLAANRFIADPARNLYRSLPCSGPCGIVHVASRDLRARGGSGNSASRRSAWANAWYAADSAGHCDQRNGWRQSELERGSSV